MTRLAAITFLSVMLLGAVQAPAQSWIFAPGPYSRNQGPAPPPAASQPASSERTGSAINEPPTVAPGPAASASAREPRAFATFTESQAAAAARIAEPTFQWDPTGVIGRGDRYDLWNHLEKMEALRLHTYAQGVRDAAGSGPVWAWPVAPVRPLPQVMAPAPQPKGAKPTGR